MSNRKCADISLSIFAIWMFILSFMVLLGCVGEGSETPEPDGRVDKYEWRAYINKQIVAIQNGETLSPEVDALMCDPEIIDKYVRGRNERTVLAYCFGVIQDADTH